jgi:hypothetical protein
MRARLELLHHEIARRLLLKQSDEEISQATGLKLATVKRTQEHPEFRDLLDRLRDKHYVGVDAVIGEKVKSITEQLQGVAQESFNRLEALLKSSSETIVRDVAQDFLDRAGYAKATPAMQTVVNIGTLEAGILVDALKREREARTLQGDKDLLKLAKPISEHANERRDNASEESARPTT